MQKSKYAKVNLCKVKIIWITIDLTSWRGLGILSLPNRTSPFVFILHVHYLALEMGTLTVALASLATPN